MALTLHLKDFEGPLDLLLYLIGKAKVNIRDIFVSEVTEQYVESVRSAPDLDMDDASAFLSMAATLLEIKSRALLPAPPQPEDQEDPEEALIRQLEEYQAIRDAARDMQDFERAAALIYEKLPEEYPLPPPTFELEGLDMAGLMTAFARVCARKPREKEQAEPEQRRILRDAHSVPMCMAMILKRLRDGSVVFDTLFDGLATREEVVSLFLALLELIRLGRVTAEQDETYGDILISYARAERSVE